MGKKLKPGQRCTNSPGVCGGSGHYYYKKFDIPSAEHELGGRCKYVQTGQQATGATRAEVYAAIDGERAYQNERWSPETTETGGKHTVTEFLVYMRDYVEEALHHLTRNADPEASEFALNSVRKVAALGVACMEQNGAPRRA